MGNAKHASLKVEANRDHLESVQGRINFARRTSDEQAPEVSLSESFPNALSSYISDPPPMLSYDITIRNARPIVNELSLDREGFTLIQYKLSCANECDLETVCDRYLEEMIPFIKNYFRASWVVARRQGVVLRSADGSSVSPVKDPIVWAHTDYVPIVGPLAAAIASQSQGIQLRSYSRLMIIHTWHALSLPPQDFPLAICDGTSVDHTDIEVVNNVVHGSALKFGVAHVNPAQRWYYFPEMTAADLLLFKGYDSDAHRNPLTVHSAFDNRRAYPNARPRESLEGRFFVYYE